MELSLGNEVRRTQTKWGTTSPFWGADSASFVIRDISASLDLVVCVLGMMCMCMCVFAQPTNPHFLA